MKHWLSRQWYRVLAEWNLLACRDGHKWRYPPDITIQPGSYFNAVYIGEKYCTRCTRVISYFEWTWTTLEFAQKRYEVYQNGSV